MFTLLVCNKQISEQGPLLLQLMKFKVTHIFLLFIDTRTFTFRNTNAIYCRVIEGARRTVTSPEISSCQLSWWFRPLSVLNRFALRNEQCQIYHF